jgi:uncharacterized protein (DUF58 family)
LKSNTGASEQGFTVSLGYPLLFHWLVLVTAGGLLLLAGFNHWLPLLIITAFLLVAAAIAFLWSRQSFRGVSCRLSLTLNRAFPEEKIDLDFELTNGKWLFMPWLEIEAELPYRLVKGQPKASPLYAKERLRWTTAVSGRQRLNWKYTLECKYRGDYTLGPLRLRCGDIFGLFPKEIILPRFEKLLVYPRVVPLERLGLPLRELTGEVVAQRNIYEDMSQTMGTRDYRSDDPLKRIHWKASARQEQFQVRQYESTTSLNLLIILDVNSFCHEPELGEEPFELAVTTAASLAYEANRQRYPVGLIAGSVPGMQIPVRSGRAQLMAILEALARVQPKACPPLHQQLDEYRSRLPMGTTMVMISHSPSPALTGLAHKLKREGHSPVLVSAGEKTSTQNIRGIPTVTVRSPGEITASFGRAAL